MIVFNIFIAVAVIFLANVCWKRRHFYRASWNLPGIWSLPLIGGSYVFWNTTDLLTKFTEILRKTGTPLGFWLGPRFVIVFTDPDDVKTVLNHPSSMDKGAVYDIIADMTGGVGLASASGDYWKFHRRLLNPAVQSTKVLNSYYTPINDSLKILVDILGKRDHNEIFSIFECIEAFSFDLFFKNTFGVDLDVQRNDCKFFELVNEALFVVRKRIFEPFYQLKPFFKLTSLYQMNKRSTDGMRSIIKDILRKRTAMLASEVQIPKEDESEKRSRSFIDEVIQLANDQKCFTEEEIISESLLMLLMGFESAAVSISNCVHMLAMHQEYQERVYQEIQKICPNNEQDITADDLAQLSYTDRFIKESMRLMPPLPFASRIAKDDFYVGKVYVPAGCELVVSTFELQRNSKIWGDDAHAFNPDHFLPERIEKQHPYSYLPFSAGARNCIGKRYAEIVLRLAVMWLVRNYKFTTDMKTEELSFKWMVVMKFNNGYRVRVEKRVEK